MAYVGQQAAVFGQLAQLHLRIYDKRTKKNVKLNGLPGSNKETHFKILKRREM